MPFKKEPEKYGPLELLYYLKLFLENPELVVTPLRQVNVSGRKIKGRTVVRYAHRLGELIREYFGRDDNPVTVEQRGKTYTIMTDTDKARAYLIETMDIIGEIAEDEIPHARSVLEELVRMMRSPKAMLACIRSIRDGNPTAACKLFVTMLDYATDPVYLKNTPLDYFVDYYNNDPEFRDYVDNVLPLEHMLLEEVLLDECRK